VVILSPASTSFDRFRNFEERGRVFKDLVTALPE
jgi:UDP-N-acetylmuramoylalanine--D-glutamate ligase